MCEGCVKLDHVGALSILIIFTRHKKEDNLWDGKKPSSVSFLQILIFPGTYKLSVLKILLSSDKFIFDFCCCALEHETT